MPRDDVDDDDAEEPPVPEEPFDDEDDEFEAWDALDDLDVSFESKPAFFDEDEDEDEDDGEEVDEYDASCPDMPFDASRPNEPWDSSFEVKPGSLIERDEWDGDDDADDELSERFLDIGDASPNRTEIGTGLDEIDDEDWELEDEFAKRAELDPVDVSDESNVVDERGVPGVDDAGDDDDDDDGDDFTAPVEADGTGALSFSVEMDLLDSPPSFNSAWANSSSNAFN